VNGFDGGNGVREMRGGEDIISYEQWELLELGRAAMYLIVVSLMKINVSLYLIDWGPISLDITGGQS
jgi:hypothetical protein